MAYFNRREALLKTLASYEKWYRHLDIEIIICDDGSEPPLFDINTTLPHKILRLPKSPALNPCVPLNHAVNASVGDVIVITNPEDEHRSPALYDMLARLRDKKDYVTAPCFDEKRGWIAGPNVDYPLAMPENAHFHFCALMHRSLFPGFDEDYRNGQAFEDNDFVCRLANAGANFICSEVPVHHNHVATKWHGSTQQNYDLLVKKWPCITSQ